MEHSLEPKRKSKEKPHKEGCPYAVGTRLWYEWWDEEYGLTEEEEEYGEP